MVLPREGFLSDALPAVGLRLLQQHAWCTALGTSPPCPCGLSPRPFPGAAQSPARSPLCCWPVRCSAVHRPSQRPASPVAARCVGQCSVLRFCIYSSPWHFAVPSARLPAAVSARIRGRRRAPSLPLWLQRAPFPFLREPFPQKKFDRPLPFRQKVVTSWQLTSSL